jgi:hypothetical protein
LHSEGEGVRIRFYWDGDRRYGYGGNKFIEGRWKAVAQVLIDVYGLTTRLC